MEDIPRRVFDAQSLVALLPLLVGLVGYFDLCLWLDEGVPLNEGEGAGQLRLALEQEVSGQLLLELVGGLLLAGEGLFRAWLGCSGHRLAGDGLALWLLELLALPVEQHEVFKNAVVALALEVAEEVRAL